MADVMEAFYRGQEAGQRQSAHKVQLEESKLAQQILKHQVEGLKIEDQIRARDLSRQNLEALQGTPEAEMPSHDVTTQQPNLPGRSMAGVIMGMQPGMGQSSMTGQENAPSTGAPGTGTFTPTPQPAPGTNPITRSVPNSVDVPGVPGLGVPGYSARPRTLEEIMQMRRTEELMKPFTVGGDQTHYPGGVGGPAIEGPGKNIVVPRGGTVMNEKTGKVIGRGQPGGRGRVMRGTLNGKLAYAVVDQETGNASIGGKDVTGDFTPEPRANSAASNQEWTRNFREYTSAVGEMNRQHADAMKAWQQKNANAFPGDETEPPTLTVPNFEEWLNQHKATSPSTGGPKAVTAQGGAPKKGDVKPIPGYPGTEQTYDGTKWVRTK